MLKIDSIKIPVSENAGNGELPVIAKSINVQNVVKNDLGEHDELFLGYGTRHNSYPYTTFDDYGALREKKVKTVVLENEFMRAVFLPEFGGRLWSLFDKANGRELLYVNDCIKLGNLAIRNAWFSGGVEWNMGFVGHSPFTCQNVYAEKVNYEGKEILRLYEFERVRQVSWQIDFWLHEKKPRLYARMRLVNKENETKPMYWWSNIAAPQYRDGRLFVNAKYAYKTDAEGVLRKACVPFDGAADVSRYNTLSTQVDYFFDTQDHPKYIVNIDGEGNGLLQYSTDRLKGRKLFYWGNRVSSRNWQKTLTEHAGDYIELQAGLARTQYESIPMPPNTAWEWIECYENAGLDASFSAMDFAEANERLSARVRAQKAEEDLENLVEKTRGAAFASGEMLHEGSGFGYLYNLLNPRKLDAHLRFTVKSDIGEFLYLAENGTMPQAEKPKEFAFSEEIRALLRRAVNSEKGKRNWYNFYQLAMLENDGDRMDLALRLAKKSAALSDNLYSNHLLMSIYRKTGSKKTTEYAKKVFSFSPRSFTVVTDALAALLEQKEYGAMLEAINRLEKALREKERIKLYRVFALAQTGRAEEAKKLLFADGGLVVADIREGEDSLDEAYLLVMRKLHPDRIFGYGDVPEKFCYKLKDG